jgi:hypothetical protein
MKRKQTEKERIFFEKVVFVSLVAWFLVTAAIGVFGVVSKLLE